MPLATALLIAEALIKYGPALARELMSLFAKQEITVADWEKIFKLAEKSYDDYVKPTTTTTVTTVTPTP